MIELFISIFKIGLFTFGGGGAMLAMLEAELVGKKKWLTRKELLNYFAIGQSTPGIIAINTATLVGYKLFGVKGALFATLAMVLPSFIIISIIAYFTQSFLENAQVKSAFAGIRIVVAAIIFQVVIKMRKDAITCKSQFYIFLTSGIIMLLFAVSPAFIAVFAGLFGHFYYKEKSL